MGKLKQLWENRAKYIGNEKGILGLLGTKRRESLFGTRKVEPPDYSGIGEMIQAPSLAARGPQEQEAFDLLGRRRIERAREPEIKLGTVGQAIRTDLERELREKAAPSFFQRGMGGQAGAAGLGAFQAREAPRLFLQAFREQEAFEEKRLAGLQPFIELGLNEREAEFAGKLPEFEKSQLLAGLEAGRRAAKYQEETSRLAQRRQFWYDLAKSGASAAAGGAGGGAGAGGGGQAGFVPT